MSLIEEQKKHLECHKAPIQKFKSKIAQLLEPICPLWAARFEDGLDSSQKEALAHPDICVVGEAHGWNNRYLNDCDACSSFGFRFYRYANWSPVSDREYGIQRFEESAAEFVEHWNSEHR